MVRPLARLDALWRGTRYVDGLSDAELSNISIRADGISPNAAT